jgi:predicted metal-dependent peptidase
MTSLALTIEDALSYLCRPSSTSFYALVVSPLKRVYTTSMPTFAVGPEGSRYVLYVNPDFARPQPFERIVMILEHEVLHVILGHCARGLTAFRMCETEDARRYFLLASPIAVDLAVNEILRRNHPMEVLKPPGREDLSWATLCEDFDLPQDRTYEEYLVLMLKELQARVPEPQKLINEIVESLREAIEAAGGIDPGSLLGQVGAKLDNAMGDSESDAEGDGEDGDPFETALKNHLGKAILEHLFEYIKDATDAAQGPHLDNHGRRIVRSAVRSYKKEGRGTLPGGLEELVNRFLAPPTVSWTELLKAYCVNAQKSKPLRGFRRISKSRAATQKYLASHAGDTPRARALSVLSKRIPLFPGTERDIRFEVYFVVDTSGSMSHDDLAVCLSELQHVQKASSDMVIHVLYVDCTVNKEYVLNSEDKLDFTMVGRGGTDFETAFKYISESSNHCDLVVYATDGHAPQPRTRLECQTIWLITKGGKHIMDGQPEIGRAHV